MSVIHCDNFSVYGGEPALMLNGVYAGFGDGGVNLVADPDGISSGSVLTMYGPSVNEGYDLLRLAFPVGGVDKAGVAQRVWLSSLPNSPQAYPIFAVFRTAGNIYLAGVSVTPSGQLAIHNYAAHNTDEPWYDDTPVAVTPAPVITANAWWHIECMMQVSTGDFEIRVEGITVLSISGQNFGSAEIAQVGWAGMNSFSPGWGGTAYYKDFVPWDGLGSQNNDLLGSVQVATLTPTADIEFGWTPTPSGAPGYEILANTPPQDTTSYLDAPNPPPGPYVCTLSALPDDVTSIAALVTMVRAAKVDGGDGSLQVSLISSPSSSPVTGNGANRPITVAQTYWRDVFELDPKTGGTWLPGAVDVVQLEINRTT